MKLKDDCIIQEIEGTQFLVPVGAEAFQGIVRNNRTAAFIVNCLKEDTSLEGIVEAVCEKYHVSKETVTDDVKEILGQLRGIHALEE